MHRRPCSVVCEIDSADKTTALLSGSVVHLSSSIFFSGFVLLDSTVITQQHAAPPWHQPAIYIQIRIRWIRNGSFLFLSSGHPSIILFSLPLALHSPPLFLSDHIEAKLPQNVTWLSLKTVWMSLSKQLSEVGEGLSLEGVLERRKLLSDSHQSSYETNKLKFNNYAD